jgi:hypothetical protein
METNTQTGLFKGLPTYAKGIIALVVTAGAVGVAYLIYKGVKKATDRGRDNTSNRTENAVRDDLNQAINSGQKLSFPKSAYAGAAETILRLLDGCETVDSELQAIGEVIKVVKKPVDWFQLCDSFGQKDVSDCGTFGFAKTRYTLPALLADQLDSVRIVTPLDKPVLGGYTVPSGFYNETGNILRNYLKTVGVTF